MSYIIIYLLDKLPFINSPTAAILPKDKSVSFVNEAYLPSFLIFQLMLPLVLMQ